MTDAQHAGGWSDPEEERLWALAPAHLRVLVDRRIAAQVAAAREAGRREGIAAAVEMANSHAKHYAATAADPTANASQRGVAERMASACNSLEGAISALLEPGR